MTCIWKATGTDPLRPLSTNHRMAQYLYEGLGLNMRARTRTRPPVSSSNLVRLRPRRVGSEVFERSWWTKVAIHWTYGPYSRVRVSSHAYHEITHELEKGGFSSTPEGGVVGPKRFELSTSRLSAGRSNQSKLWAHRVVLEYGYTIKTFLSTRASEYRHSPPWMLCTEANMDARASAPCGLTRRRAREFARDELNTMNQLTLLNDFIIY